MRATLLILGALTLLLAVVEPALAGNGGFGPVPPESPNAEGISQSYWFITAFILAIFVLVEGLLVAFVVRFRRRRRARSADGAQIHGSTRLETMWTVGPVVILFAIAAFVLVKLPGIQDVPAAGAAGGRIDVTVSGRQYYWQYEYPNGVVTVQRLVVPQGRPVKLTVVAPDWDVIHSWWIPALGGKLDAIPGRVNVTWFEAQSVGVFRGQCAELCGLQHAEMLAEVEVKPAAAFDAWLEQRRAQQTARTSPLGRETYVGACSGCHGLSGEGAAAAGLPGKAPAIAASSLLGDPQALAQLLANGRQARIDRIMPPVGRGWSTEQLDALTAYLQETIASGS